MKIGYLYENRSTGRYELFDDDYEYITYFTCGDRIEIYFGDEGYSKGRIEHSLDMEGYYFFGDNGEKKYIYNGMPARVNL